MPKVLVYTSPTCGYCNMVKQYLSQINVGYEEKDVTDPKIAEEAVARSGQMGVPVVVIGEGDSAKIITGFNKDEIDNALKQ